MEKHLIHKGKIIHSGEQKNTIFVSVITSFITTFMGSALNLSIPAIEEEFGVSAATVGWVVTIYMLTCAALTVPFGRIADVVQRKKILCAGLLVFTGSSFAAVISWQMWVLLMFRFIQGIGASMIFSTNIAILVGTFGVQERGKVLGFSTCATYVGLSAGPVLGGILNYNLGWKSIFIATAIVSAVASYAAITKLPGTENTISLKKEDWDLKGNFLFIGGIAASMYGLSSITSNAAAPYLLILGLGLMAAFVINELKVGNPVIKISVFKNNIAFTLSNFAALLNYGATFANSYFLSIYLQVVKGMSSQTAGFVLITATAVQALLSPVAGRLSDRYSPYILSSAGMGICAVVLAFLTFLPENASILMIVVILIVSGVGFALFASPNTNAVMACVEKADYSVASSILATMRSIGHTTSMAIVTVVVSAYLENESLNAAQPATIMETMHTAFLIFTILCILGIFMALKRKV